MVQRYTAEVQFAGFFLFHADDFFCCDQSVLHTSAAEIAITKQAGILVAGYAGVATSGAFRFIIRNPADKVNRNAAVGRNATLYPGSLCIFKIVQCRFVKRKLSDVFLFHN
jgi:hypothetical protein